MAEKQSFPPISWLWQDYRRAAAWYSGEPNRIAKEGGAPAGSFWSSDERIRIHVPLAADISAMSANMIFAESPVIGCDDKKTAERIEEITKKAGIYATFLQAAELASAYGGVFLKWSWDKSDGFPRLTAVPADAGLPIWAGGKIVEIRLWNTVKEGESDGAIWRLMESYTPDGHIRSRLYRGDAANLGDEHALKSLTETRKINPDAYCGVDAMLAYYVPNILPNRKKPHLRFGRSDYEGLYGMFDALDEAYSALQRETRMTKTTVIVPAEYLRRREALFDGAKAHEWVYSNNTGAFTALDIDSDRSSSPITVINPEMRSESRIKACDDIIRRVLSMAGYAPQSAGLDIEGSAESGTALNVRERKSIRTTEMKKTHWWHAVNDLVREGLKLDAAVFRSGVKTDAQISIELPTEAQPDITQLAQVVEQLERAGAVSIETKVDILHPDWEGKKRAEEVERIRKQNGMAAQAEMNRLLARMQEDDAE